MATTNNGDIQKMEILVFGLGAMGSFYSLIFSRSPNVRLTVVARSNYEVAKANGFTVNSKNHGGEHHVQPHSVIKNPSEAPGHYDFVVCCNKVLDQDEIAKSLAPVIDNDTTIVLLQNGIGVEEPFRKIYPNHTIISGSLWVGAIQTSPGYVTHNAAETTKIGLYHNHNISPEAEESRLSSFAKLFSTASSHLEVFPNIQIQCWGKVTWNIAWSNITTLTMIDTQAWLHSSPEAVVMMKRLMGEAIQIARKSGVDIEEGLNDVLVEKMLNMPAEARSMQMDVKCGRRLEVDAILGVPVRRGRDLGLGISTLETVYALVLGVDRGLMDGVRVRV